MRTIPLSQGKVALVDDADFERLSKFNWFAHKHTRKNRTVFYAVRNARFGGKCVTLALHREVLGVFDTKIKIDHKNLNELDNRKQNLRLATNTQNGWNSQKAPSRSSQFKGVCWHKQRQRWMARIHVNGQQRHLGLFEIEEDAACAYAAAAKQHFGEFALC